MGGQVDMVFETMPTLMGNVKSEKLRFIGVTTNERAKSLPDVATLHEQGVTSFDVTTRYVLLAPKGTPKEILAKLSGAMKQAAQVPAVQQAMAGQGAIAVPSSPDDTNSALSDEVAIWAEVVSNADLK
jgi:tripartite-type tricarboxylate transporter receptor subunit TctC